MHRHVVRFAVGIGAAAAMIIPATSVAASGTPAQLDNSSLTVASVGNLPSVGAEAYSFSEFGNEVNLVGNHLGSVTVMLSSWGCQTGSWTAHNCGTTSGATFAEPVTCNLYAPRAGQQRARCIG